MLGRLQVKWKAEGHIEVFLNTLNRTKPHFVDFGIGLWKHVFDKDGGKVRNMDQRLRITDADSDPRFQITDP
ncbi:hypothetical protein Trydic_g8031 [Trypoxylus dichotomus]